MNEQTISAILTPLNDPQREAVLSTEGPLMVLAGAGSGKTKMLTSRIAYLIAACDVQPRNILAVTFTNKAAREMRERVEKMFGHLPYAPEIGTFHSVCIRLIRREMMSTPFTKPFVVYDDSDQLSLLKKVCNELQIDDKVFSAKSFQAAINRAKCDALEPSDIQPEAHHIFEKKLKTVFELYQKKLFANNALDFGEIICMTYRLLRDYPEIRKKYQDLYRYIHVDEYQDTNRSQYLLISQLANSAFGGHSNLCVVGDEDQSIYKWRGADIKNILDFETEFPGAAVVKLEENYRSTQTIITGASKLISHNRQRKDKTLFTNNEPGDKIIRTQLPNERFEADFVIGEIKRLASNEGYSFKEFAIFYRTHAQSRQFEEALRREKIAYKISGGLRFYDRKEIKDILAYFKAILNPSDSIGLKRILNVPARGIGKTTVEKIEALETQMPFWDALTLASKDPSITNAGTAKKINGFVTLLGRLMTDYPKLRLSELYHQILHETGYIQELKGENTDESLARIENLEEFSTLLQEFEEGVLRGLTEEDEIARHAELLPLFIEQSSLATDTDLEQNPDLDAVQMMTLHSSKGLEFPVVFLVGMEDGLFPSIREWEELDEEDLEEERRLCYVGMTRAREHLFMTHVDERRIWGTVNFQKPARFFQEIPEDLIEFRSVGGAAPRFRQEAEPLSSGTSGFAGLSSSAAKPSRVGINLQHPDYGLGKIVTSEGMGNDEKVTVEFRGGTRRKFLLRFLLDYLQS